MLTHLLLIAFISISVNYFVSLYALFANCTVSTMSTYSVIDSAISVHIILFPPEMLYMFAAAHLYSWKQSSTAVLHQGLCQMRSPCSQGQPNTPTLNRSPERNRIDQSSGNADNMWHLISLTLKHPLTSVTQRTLGYWCKTPQDVCFLLEAEHMPVI